MTKAKSTAQRQDSEENNWGFGTDTREELLAGRIYGHAVERVRSAAAEHDVQCERLSKTLEAARSEADRSAAILLFALAEDLMLSGLKQHLSGQVKGGWDDVSSGNGLLATASDRITLLALLGWIHPAVYDGLRTLKSIRNRFAHHPDVIGFDEQKISGFVSALAPLEKTTLEALGRPRTSKLTTRQTFLCRSANIIVQLVSNLAVAPSARTEKVAPGHVDMVPWEKLPTNLQDLYKILAEHMAAVAGPKT